MYRISRSYTFSAAHRIEGHPKCGRLHGHNYHVTVTLYGDTIPGDGMLLDYGEMDKVVKPFIDQCDHRYIVSLSNVAARDPYTEVAIIHDHAATLPIQASTGELLARYFQGELKQLFRDRLGIGNADLAVEVCETDKSTARYEESW